MIAFILMLTSIAFQISAQITTGYENVDYVTDNHYNVGVKVGKRYLGALAKNKQLPAIERRSYFVPPLVSTYGNDEQKPSFTKEFDAAVEKRYLGTLARGRDPKSNNPHQQKRAAAEPEDEVQTSSKDDQPDPMVMKEEIINTLRPIIVEYLKEFKKKYDPRKVDLFLRNLANAIYDQNEEVSMESIRALAQLDYFQPEEDVETTSKDFHKRNIQALLRGLTVSYSGSAAPGSQHREARRPWAFSYDRYEATKRNLASLLKNKQNKRYMGAMVEGNGLSTHDGAAKRRIDENAAEYWRETGSPYQYDGEEEEKEEEVEPFRRVGKRHTMYDINEPDITFEYPSQADQADYSDYAEQDAAIPIGKRYLGSPRHGGRIFVGRIPGHQRRREQNCFKDKRRVC